MEGTYLSGKTTTAVALIKTFLLVTQNHIEDEERKKQAKKVKTYSIKELMDNDSSDDEGYTYSSSKAGTKNFFPWYQPGYKHISDHLDFT